MTADDFATVGDNSAWSTIKTIIWSHYRWEAPVLELRGILKKTYLIEAAEADSRRRRRSLWHGLACSVVLQNMRKCRTAWFPGPEKIAFITGSYGRYRN